MKTGQIVALVLSGAAVLGASAGAVIVATAPKAERQAEAQPEPPATAPPAAPESAAPAPKAAPQETETFKWRGLVLDHREAQYAMIGIRDQQYLEPVWAERMLLSIRTNIELARNHPRAIGRHVASSIYLDSRPLNPWEQQVYRDLLEEDRAQGRRDE